MLLITLQDIVWHARQCPSSVGRHIFSLIANFTLIVTTVQKVQLSFGFFFSTWSIWFCREGPILPMHILAEILQVICKLFAVTNVNKSK